LPLTIIAIPTNKTTYAGHVPAFYYAKHITIPPFLFVLGDFPPVLFVSCFGAVLQLRFCRLYVYNKGTNLYRKSDVMQPLIKPSSELRKNYTAIADTCRNSKLPIFLTKNGEGDMVIMDIETYGRREENLLIAERLLAAERARLAGTKGYTVDEFESNMRQAIRSGAKANE